MGNYDDDFEDVEVSQSFTKDGSSHEGSHDDDEDDESQVCEERIVPQTRYV